MQGCQLTLNFFLHINPIPFEKDKRLAIRMLSKKKSFLKFLPLLYISGNFRN